jgi:hypothetical protein
MKEPILIILNYLFVFSDSFIGIWKQPPGYTSRALIQDGGIRLS